MTLIIYEYTIFINTLKFFVFKSLEKYSIMLKEVVLNIKLLIVYILNEGRHIEYLHCHRIRINFCILI